MRKMIQSIVVLQRHNFHNLPQIEPNQFFSSRCWELRRTNLYLLCLAMRLRFIARVFVLCSSLYVQLRFACVWTSDFC
ncbi:hypothetical protein Plhal304r1_c029g0094651 [Plasmopara halstedii]